MRYWVLACVLAVGCKGKDKAPAGSASGSAPAAVAADAAATIDAGAQPAAVGKLDVDTEDSRAELAIAFDKKVPVLPAVSRDGKLVADYTSGYGGMPPPVTPYDVTITPLGSGGKDETISIVDDSMIGEEPWDDKPPPAATIKTLQARGAAVMKRLEGFASLAPLEVAQDGPTKLGVGDSALAITENDDESLLVTLTRGGRVVRRALVEPYGSDEKPASFMGASCSYRPMGGGPAYLDAAKQTVYVAVVFRFHEECTQQPRQWIVWPLAGEDPNPSAAFAKDAVAIEGSSVVPAKTKIESGTQLVVTTSADGKSAWASVVGADGARASHVLALTSDGWRVIATTSTKAMANAAANADAKSGKLKPGPAFTAEAGDEGLRAAFAKLTTDGMKNVRGDAIAFGSGPGERTTTGPVLAKGWNAGWKGKTTITSSIARVTPSGTTGWVAANVELAKSGYKIPFRIFAVFDKASGGEWTLVHLHFSV